MVPICVCVMCRFCEDAFHEVLEIHPSQSEEDPNVLRRFNVHVSHCSCLLTDHVSQCSSLNIFKW